MSAATAQSDRPVAAILTADTGIGADAKDHSEELSLRTLSSQPALHAIGREDHIVDPESHVGLEALLSFLFSNALPMGRSRNLAHQCAERFGSVSAILSTPNPDLLACLDGDRAALALLRCVHKLVLGAFRDPLEERPLLKNTEALNNYLRVTLANETREVVRLLFLNARNALLRDELHTRGTVNHTPVYPREIVRRVIELNACALIIVHNHPSGDPTPSQEDVEMTKLLRRVLKDIGVVLHDSVIVGRTRCASLRALGLM